MQKRKCSNPAHPNYDWDDYSAGYDDGKQDKAEGAPDLLWDAIPTRHYTDNHPYWDGYGDGWGGFERKYQEDYSR